MDLKSIQVSFENLSLGQEQNKKNIIQANTTKIAFDIDTHHEQMKQQKELPLSDNSMNSIQKSFSSGIKLTPQGSKRMLQNQKNSSNKMIDQLEAVGQNGLNDDVLCVRYFQKLKEDSLLFFSRNSKRKQNNIKYLIKSEKQLSLKDCVKRLFSNSRQISQQKRYNVLRIILEIKKIDDQQKIKRKQFTQKQERQFTVKMTEEKGFRSVKELCNFLQLDNHSFFIWIGRYQRTWRKINYYKDIYSQELQTD